MRGVGDGKLGLCYDVLWIHHLGGLREKREGKKEEGRKGERQGEIVLNADETEFLCMQTTTL